MHGKALLSSDNVTRSCSVFCIGHDHPMHSFTEGLYHVILQEYWPAVMNFVEQHSLSEPASDEQDAGEGVAEAVQASQAGVKPPSAVGPLGLASHEDEAQQGAAGFKKEL